MTATITPFPVSDDRIKAECRRLFEAYQVVTNAIPIGGATLRRAREIYERRRDTLAAWRVDEARALRMGAQG